VDEARAKLALAQVRLDAARRRHDTLATAAFGTAERLWVRVPLYAGDVRDVASDVPASIAQLGANANEAKRPGKRVSGPSSANPAAAAIDLYFEVANGDGALQPGEKVDVTLTLRESEPTVVVPWSAVLHDVHGGEWIYEHVGPHAYSRRRIQVRHVTDGLAALTNAPPPGTPVVIEGAAELFSTEFGVGK
jgi:multidrug efflux pump subunit AcrA (membrane-fusion protein)